MDEHHRTSDLLITELKTQFSDFVERYERDQMSAKSWRTNVENTLSDLSDFQKNAKFSYRFLLGIGGLVIALVKGFELIKAHLK